MIDFDEEVKQILDVYHQGYSPTDRLMVLLFQFGTDLARDFCSICARGAFPSKTSSGDFRHPTECKLKKGQIMFRPCPANLIWKRIRPLDDVAALIEEKRFQRERVSEFPTEQSTDAASSGVDTVRGNESV